MTSPKLPAAASVALLHFGSSPVTLSGLALKFPLSFVDLPACAWLLVKDTASKIKQIQNTSRKEASDDLSRSDGATSLVVDYFTLILVIPVCRLVLLVWKGLLSWRI